MKKHVNCCGNFGAQNLRTPGSHKLLRFYQNVAMLHMSDPHANWALRWTWLCFNLINYFGNASRERLLPDLHRQSTERLTKGDNANKFGIPTSTATRNDFCGRWLLHSLFVVFLFWSLALAPSFYPIFWAWIKKFLECR